MGIDKVMNAVDGKKTYILAALGVITAIVGHFWGPIQIGGTTIPKESWNDVMNTIYGSGIVASLRHAISKGAN